jgi:hypothetical protein
MQRVPKHRLETIVALLGGGGGILLGRLWWSGSESQWSMDAFVRLINRDWQVSDQIGVMELRALFHSHCSSLVKAFSVSPVLVILVLLVSLLIMLRFLSSFLAANH